MVRALRRVKCMMQIMTRIPSCCFLTSTLVTLFVIVIIQDLSYTEAAETTPTTTTTTAEPFLKSTMFIGLASGIGGFVAFVLLGCVLWKCCCGSKD